MLHQRLVAAADPASVTLRAIVGDVTSQIVKQFDAIGTDTGPGMMRFVGYGWIWMNMVRLCEIGM